VFVPADARAVLERLQAALNDYDVSTASAVLGDLDALAMPGNGDLVRLRIMPTANNPDEARVLATRLLAQIG
jgi:hypothetical protein